MVENNEKLKDFSWDTWEEAPLGEVKQAPPVKEIEEETQQEQESVKQEVEETPKEEIEFDNIKFVDDQEEERNLDSSLLSRLKSEGLFSALENEEFTDELSDDDLPDIIDKEVDARVEETMESFFEEMDDDAIAFLKFKKNGGSTSDFIKAYNRFTSVPQGDIDNEDYQEKVIMHGMQLEGYDQEDIEDKIEWLKEGAKLKRHAQKYEAKLDRASEIEKQKLVQQQQQQAQQAKQQREKLSADLKQRLEQADTIGQFTFSKQDKKHLHSYMTRPKVKVGKDNYMTQMQADLQNVFQDPEKILIIAKLLRNDFDVSDVIRNTETKVTRKTKDKIERKSTNLKSSNSSTGRRKKALFEYFDD